MNESSARAADLASASRSAIMNGTLSRRGLLGAMGGAAAMVLLDACGSSGGASSAGSSGSTPSAGSGGGSPAAPAGSTKSSGPLAGGGSLAFGLFAEPDSLDPAVMRLISSYYVVGQVYDQLLWKISGDSTDKFVPGLATGYKVSEDGKTYTFTLRSGVKFHDGTDFNAAAVKASFDRLVDPATKSVKAKVGLGSYSGSKVVDDTTLEVNFAEPNGAFLDNVAGPLLAIVSPTAAKGGTDKVGRNPVGTGPFKFKSWTAGESIVLERNDDYSWGPDEHDLKGPARVSEVTFRIVASSPSQANALQSGSLQIAQGMEVADIVRLGRAGFQKKVVPSSGGPFGFMLTATKFPTDDPLVRQAMQYACDQKTILSTNFSDLYAPANTVTTSATLGHDDTVTYSYDPDKAKALLDQAGWKMGSDGIRHKDGKDLSLVWLLFSGFGWKDPATLFASQLQEIGFKSEISEEPPSSALAKSQQGVMNVSGFSYADPDPYFMKNLFSCGQAGTGSNFSHYCDTSVDSAIEAANATPDLDQRIADYKKIQQSIMKAAVFVPIYDYAVAYVTSKGLKGLEFTSLAVPILTGVSI